MKTLCILAGIGIAWAAAVIYRPAIRWAFTDQPATHPACTPKYRTWHDGVKTEGEW